MMTMTVQMKPLDKKKKPNADSSHPFNLVLQYIKTEQHINAVSTIIIVNPFMPHTPLNVGSSLLDYLLLLPRKRRFFCGTFNKPLFVYILCNKLELVLL